ncbi:MAG: GumC family protein [Syntrophobacteraceae bacterium]
MGQELELAAVKKILLRRKGWILWPFMAILLLTGIICVVLPNIYKSTATILILNQQIPSALVPSTVTTYAQERIQAITQEVMSRTKLLKLVEKYNLLPDKRAKITTEELVEALRKRITFQTINAEVNKETQSQPVLLTIAFSLSYEDENPGKSQAVTNEIVSFYLEKNLESREKVARGTTEFLTEQLKQEVERMNVLQTRLAEFREQYLEVLPEFTALNMQKVERLSMRASEIGLQIRSLEEQRTVLKSNQAMLDPYSGAASKVMTPSERLQNAQYERAQLQSKYSGNHPLVQAKNQEIAILVSEGKGGAGTEQLADKLKAAEANLSTLKSQYSDKHPSVEKAMREIQEIESELAKKPKRQQTRSKATAATNPAYITLQSEQEKIEVSIASLKAERKQVEEETKQLYAKLRATPLVAKQFSEMDNEYQASKFNYTAIQQKLLAAKVSQGMEEDKKGESFQVVEPAFLPEKPAKPNRLAILLIGAVLALGASAGMAAMREFSDPRIYDLEAIEKLSGARVISMIPQIAFSEDIIKRRKRKMILGVTSLCALVGAVLIVHFFVMDLDIFSAKVERLINRKMP